MFKPGLSEARASWRRFPNPDRPGKGRLSNPRSLDDEIPARVGISTHVRHPPQSSWVLYYPLTVRWSPKLRQNFEKQWKPPQSPLMVSGG